MINKGTKSIPLHLILRPDYVPLEQQSGLALCTSDYMPVIVKAGP